MHPSPQCVFFIEFINKIFAISKKEKVHNVNYTVQSTNETSDDRVASADKSKTQQKLQKTSDPTQYSTVHQSNCAEMCTHMITKLTGPIT